jgi:cell division protease FtsH
MLEDNRDILEAMTQALMKFETIDSAQIDELMDRKPVSAPDGWDESDRSAKYEEAKAKSEQSDESRSDGSDEPDGDAPDQNIH